MARSLIAATTLLIGLEHYRRVPDLEVIVYR